MATIPALFPDQDFPFLPNFGSVSQPVGEALLGDSEKQSFPLLGAVAKISRPPQAGGALSAIRNLARIAQSRRTVAAQMEKTRLEFAWLAANRARYARRWVALDGDCLLAVADTAREVFAAVRNHPRTPLVTQVEPAETIHFAGW